MRHTAGEAERWITTRHDQLRAWRNAADLSDALLSVSPQRLRAFADGLWQVVQRYADESPAQRSPGVLVRRRPAGR